MNFNPDRTIKAERLEFLPFPVYRFAEGVTEEDDGL